MEPRGDSRRGSAWFRQPQSARSSAAQPEPGDEDEYWRRRSSTGDCLRMAGNEDLDILLEENADLTDRLSRAERKLHQARSEARALREKVLEYEAKERYAADEEEETKSDGSCKSKKTVAFRVSAVRPSHCSEAEEPLRKATDEEEIESSRQQLSDLENRYAAAMTEGATLRAELAEVEQLGQSWLMDVEEVREVLQETQLTLEKERELLKEAQDEARRLRDELHALRLNEEDGKVVFAHRSSLGPTQRRRNRKLVTANLMSQLETNSTCTETSEDAGNSNAETTQDEVPEEVPEAKGNAGDSRPSQHHTIAAAEDAGSELRKRSCGLICDLEEAQLVKEGLQKSIDTVQIRLAQTEARLKQEQLLPARRKSRDLLEVQESALAARDTELQESRKTVRNLEQRLVLMERIATDWKRRALSSQDSIWHRIGISVWSGNFCATSRVGVAPAA